MHCINKDVGRKIGEMFGKVHEVSIPANGGKEGTFLRILVDIDLTQPILRGTVMRMGGGKSWVEFRYERCPDFCYMCGLVGHNQKVCTERRKEEAEEVDEQYGGWMKSGINRSRERRRDKKENEMFKEEKKQD